MSHDIEIRTDRLILRHPILSDAAEINRALNEVWPDLQKWMVWAYDGQKTMEATKAFIENIGNDSLIGLCRETGRFVLSTGLMKEEKPDEYNTGYWVAKEFLGKGFATEGTAAAIHFAFDVLRAKSIHIGYLEGNDKSKRIIEKLGFDFVEKTLKTHACCADGAFMDEYEFIMTNKARLPDIRYEWSGKW